MKSRPAAFAPAATLARDQWVASVAHELRSPLNSIKSWTHVLDQHLRGEDDTVRRAVAGIMTGSSTRCASSTSCSTSRMR